MRLRILLPVIGLLALGPACREASGPGCGGDPCLYELGTLPLVGLDGREVLPAGYAHDSRAVYQLWGGWIRFDRDGSMTMELDFREFVRETGASNRLPESWRYSYSQTGLTFTTAQASGAYAPATRLLALSTGIPHAQVPPHELLFRVPGDSRTRR
jgi:hypothetical protein